MQHKCFSTTVSNFKVKRKKNFKVLRFYSSYVYEEKGGEGFAHVSGSMKLGLHGVVGTRN